MTRGQNEVNLKSKKDLINTWETTISKLKERDEELVQEEMKNVDIKEELIAREQIIKGTFFVIFSMPCHQNVTVSDVGDSKKF